MCPLLSLVEVNAWVFPEAFRQTLSRKYFAQVFCPSLLSKPFAKPLRASTSRKHITQALNPSFETKPKVTQWRQSLVVAANIPCGVIQRWYFYVSCGLKSKLRQCLFDAHGLETSAASVVGIHRESIALTCERPSADWKGWVTGWAPAKAQKTHQETATSTPVMGN